MASSTHSLHICDSEPVTDSAEESCVRETPCDLCGEREFEVVARNDRRGRELSTVVCRHCGLVSHLAVPSEDELLRYYRRHYRREYHGQGSPSPHRVVRAWRRGAELLKLLSPILKPATEVLDIGAGLGCTVKQLELAGLAASGIEPGAAFQEFSQRRLSARVQPGIWRELAPRPRYQLILLVHVIEHLSSPREALTHLRRLLVPGGQLYVECPNLYAPHSAPGRMFHPAHVYNFTPATLAMLCRSCGFEIEATLSGERDRNLRFLLTRSPVTDDKMIAGSYEQTIEALSRHNTLTYHLRWSYLRDRIRGFFRDLSDHWQARRRVEKIVAKCRQGNEPEATRRAA